MEKAKIRPLATLKPFDQSWQKLAWGTTSWTSLGSRILSRYIFWSTLALWRCAAKV